MRHSYSAAAAAVVLSIVAGCMSRKSEPLAGPTRLDTPQLIAGQRAFNQTCHQCHPHGEAGLGPALNNKPLPAFMVKNQVRKGGGAMPPFTELQIPDEELNNLVAYMAKLRAK